LNNVKIKYTERIRTYTQTHIQAYKLRMLVFHCPASN
jgi:hypothetical protein